MCRSRGWGTVNETQQGLEAAKLVKKAFEYLVPILSVMLVRIILIPHMHSALLTLGSYISADDPFLIHTFVS